MSLRERLHFTAEPVYLVDGNAFFYRGFYAFRDMSRSDGLPTNALYVVLRMLLKLLREERPAHLAFFLDGKGPTFRNALYPAYKAQRPPTPEGLVAQIEPLRRAVQVLGIPLVVSQDGEADDCIASVAARHRDQRPVVIVGADKDFNQCLAPGVVIWDPSQKSEKLTTLESFQATQPLEPAQWPDYQALIGDTADNIPGIPGVGPKTALTIMRDHPTLEDLRDHLAELPDKLRAKVADHVEQIFIFRQLTRLRTDLCPELSLEALAPKVPDWQVVQAFLAEFEFRSLARELPEAARKAPETPTAQAPAAVQDGAEPAPKAAKGSATAGGPKAAQLSLLADTQAAPSQPLLLREATQAWQLPRRQGQVVGLVLHEGAIRLGLGHEELHWTGEVTALVTALTEATTVATPDLKALLAADPAWRALPLERWFDLGLAAYLLSPEERGYGWARLRDALRLEADTLPHPEAQGLAALALHAVLARKLESAGLVRLLAELETPLVPVLVDMEARGIAIDAGAFEGFLAEVSRDIEALTTEIHAAAGGPFNIRSSQQLATLLFETLGLKPKGKTPQGALSTASEVLEKLRGEHPVVEKILEFRMLDKLRSTYLEPLPKLADAAGRIHTTFNQLATATGRLSSSGPNLQNIPIRGRLGGRMRACFVAAPGQLLVSADYSQIELRVLAHMSQDPGLLDAFRHGADIHAATAALIFGKEPAQVTTDERRGAKTINFGLLYGMGPQKLAQELGISLAEAKEFIERYFAKLTRLKAFYEGIVAEAETSGYVTTLAGRRRLLPELHSRSEGVKAQARRQAINTVIQGSAADIIKLAMLAVDRDAELRTAGARLLLQVHDELVLEAPPQGADAAAARVRELMSGVVALDVPLMVDVGVGEDWDKAH